jgi:hypothetical protein
MEEFIPYLKPQYRDDHRRITIEDVERNGEIVKIVDTRSVDGKNDILERTYYHENGAYGTLSAVCMGVDSLPTV